MKTEPGRPTMHRFKVFTLQAALKVLQDGSTGPWNMNSSNEHVGIGPNEVAALLRAGTLNTRIVSFAAELNELLQTAALFAKHGDLVSRASFAERLGCSEETIRRRVKSGQLPKPLNIEGKEYFAESDVARTCASTPHDAAEFTVSLRATAQRLGCSTETIRRRQLPSMRRGKETFFRERDVAAEERLKENARLISEYEFVTMLKISPSQFAILCDHANKSQIVKPYDFPKPAQRTREGDHRWYAQEAKAFAARFKSDPEGYLGRQFGFFQRYAGSTKGLDVLRERADLPERKRAEKKRRIASLRR